MTYSSFSRGGTVTKLGRMNTQVCDTILVTSFCFMTSYNHFNSSFFKKYLENEHGWQMYDYVLPGMEYFI